ncbi:uncharacterized protein LODBEIA_P15850 [Lodderomyces beijingensis]|uniref:Uncharacterized protein n=1 Tax=Lodderomyces beijingensis TaxID=1775926 RepID=A0ABP0ZGR2_9ASCO
MANSYIAPPSTDPTAHQRLPPVTSFLKLHYKKFRSKMMANCNELSASQLSNPALLSTLLASSCTFLYRNAYQYFSIFSDEEEDEVIEFRENLVRLFVKYYGIALYNLRLSLNNKDMHSLNMAFTASMYLNTISMYECESVDQSFTFSSGTIQLADDMISNHKKLANDFVLVYLKHVYMAWYCPPYDPTCIQELRAIVYGLSRYEKLFQNESTRRMYTNLVKFMELLDNPAQMATTYHLFRQWMLIVPSKTYFSRRDQQPPFDEIEAVLLSIYRALERMLQSMCPRSLFFNLHLLDLNPIASIAPSKSVSTNFTDPHLGDIYNYSNRVFTFFHQRKQILQHLLDDLDNVEIVSQALSEVPIYEFMTTNFNFYNYPHFPMTLPLQDLNAKLNNKIDLQLLFNNKHQQDYWTRYKVNEFQDPMIKSHYRNMGLGLTKETYSLSDTFIAHFASDFEQCLINAYRDLFNGAVPQEDFWPPDEIMVPHKNRHTSLAQIRRLLNKLREMRKVKVDEMPGSAPSIFSKSSS